MSKHEPSFAPAFVRTSVIIEMLGIAQATFYERRPALEAEGFPKPDPVMRLYLRSDVEAWIQSRRRVPDPDTVPAVSADATINWAAL